MDATDMPRNHVHGCPAHRVTCSLSCSLPDLLHLVLALDECGQDRLHDLHLRNQSVCS